MRINSNPTSLPRNSRYTAVLKNHGTGLPST
nr:MAG TPA: hypothetical protein [Caudoviricetes sp.]